MSIDTHSQTLLVREAILLCVKEEERGQVCIGKPVLRQSEGRIVVENFDTLCISKLTNSLPHGCRVYSRAPPSGAKRLTLSRLEIYYPLETVVWKWKSVILTVVWVFCPLVLSFYIASGHGKTSPY